MIVLKNIKICTISVDVDMPIDIQKQLARKLEKYLLKEDIVCDVEVKDD